MVRDPERNSGDQPHGGPGGDALHGQQLRPVAFAGQAVHERGGAHQGRRLPGEMIILIIIVLISCKPSDSGPAPS